MRNVRRTSLAAELHGYPHPDGEPSNCSGQELRRTTLSYGHATGDKQETKPRGFLLQQVLWLRALHWRSSTAQFKGSALLRSGHGNWMAGQPKCAGADHRIDANIPPPCRFVAKPVDLTMMSPTQRHSEFIADLAPERATLHEAQVMCVRWQTTANQTWLFGNRFDVLPVSNAAWLWSRQKGLIDASGRRPLLCSALVPMICSSRLLRFRHRPVRLRHQLQGLPVSLRRTLRRAGHRPRSYRSSPVGFDAPRLLPLHSSRVPRPEQEVDGTIQPMLQRRGSASCHSCPDLCRVDEWLLEQVDRHHSTIPGPLPLISRPLTWNSAASRDPVRQGHPRRQCQQA